MAKLIPKIILEGTRLTQKTELAFALNEHPRIVGPRKYRYHSPIVSAEWGGFSNHPWGHGLINFDAEEEERALETYRTWMHLFELQPYYSWIVDRFHISTQVYQQIHHRRRYDFSWLEERLLALDFRIIHCVRDAESFPAAREERLKVSGNPKQYDDLSIFLEEQSLFAQYVQDSALSSLRVDMTGDDIDAACDQIADWMEATGGLTKPD